MTSAYEQGTEPHIEVRHRLFIAREHAGLNQDQLAERMQVTRSTISNAETGAVSPRRTTINAWAIACGVPAEWIRTGKESQGNPGPDSGLGIIRSEKKIWSRRNGPESGGSFDMHARVRYA